MDLNSKYTSPSALERTRQVYYHQEISKDISIQSFRKDSCPDIHMFFLFSEVMIMSTLIHKCALWWRISYTIFLQQWISNRFWSKLKFRVRSVHFFSGNTLCSITSTPMKVTSLDALFEGGSLEKPSYGTCRENLYSPNGGESLGKWRCEFWGKGRSSRSHEEAQISVSGITFFRNKTFSLLESYGITLSPKKSYLGYPTVALLGQKVDAFGLRSSIICFWHYVISK